MPAPGPGPRRAWRTRVLLGTARVGYCMEMTDGAPRKIHRNGRGGVHEIPTPRATADAPVSITSADYSYEQQHRARVRKYLLLMSFRVPALLGASMLYGVTGNALAATIVLVVSIPLPWIAVLIANDRPPIKKRRGLSGVDRDAGIVIDDVDSECSAAGSSSHPPRPRTI
jgi:hypothetical protein